jgi:hypothetical protein
MHVSMEIRPNILRSKTYISSCIYSMSCDVDYDRYARYVDTICDLNDLSSFKRKEDYTYMLEHVNQEQGHQYLRCLQTNTNLTLTTLQGYCKLNDSIGNPEISNYGDIQCSPSSLRYLYHAHLILTHFKSFNEPSYNFIEIGGGYGGLCLAIQTLAPLYDVSIKSYTIIDLPAPSRLQEKYLRNFSLQAPVIYLQSGKFGADAQQENYYLISNYCFSEIRLDFQTQYIQYLFPRVIHGFMAWNNIPTYDFGFQLKVEPEMPNTGNMFNKYVYF